MPQAVQRQFVQPRVRSPLPRSFPIRSRFWALRTKLGLDQRSMHLSRGRGGKRWGLVPGKGGHLCLFFGVTCVFFFWGRLCLFFVRKQQSRTRGLLVGPMHSPLPIPKPIPIPLHMHMLIYIYTCIYTCICICVHIHRHTHIPIHIHIHRHTHIYICTYVHMYIYTYIHIYIYTYIHIYIFTYLHIYIYTYIHIYIYTYIHIYIALKRAKPDRNRNETRPKTKKE